MSTELPLPTDTALIRIASRQYRLFNFDLGEGIPRVALKVGACTFPPWFLLCWAIGVDLPGLLLVWLAPPVLLTWAAMSRDEGGRLRVVGWVDWAMWQARRRRPIVNGGTGSAATPRPIATPIAFLISEEPFFDNALEGIDASVRADFITPPGRESRLDRLLRRTPPAEETTSAQQAA